MWWPWQRAEPEPDLNPPEDDVSRRLRHLADHWQRDPGVRPWIDLLPARLVDRPDDPLTEATQLLPTYPLLTPAQQYRSQGGVR